MCYGMGCVWENWEGDCTKPGKQPCPMEEEQADWQATLEQEFEEQEELRRYEEEQGK